MKRLTLLFSLFLGAVIANAQNTNYTVLHNFNIAAGEYPSNTLTLSGKTLFGTTYAGGHHDSGVVFSMDTNGNNYKVLYTFGGGWPMPGHPTGGSLKLAGNRLYGMTSVGGIPDSGCVFSIDTDGSGFRELYDFGGTTTGATPQGSLTLVRNKLFGMTFSGGSSNLGVVFTLDTLGNNFKLLYTFTGGAAGGNPYGDVTVIKDKLFGMSSRGVNGDGNIFSLDSNGTNYTDLFDFSGTDGKYPNNILLNKGNKFFGMTNAGGAYSDGNVFSIDTNCSTSSFVDILDLNGTNYPSYGQYPYADVMFSNGFLYGTAASGGSMGVDSGVVFKVDTNGARYTELHSFQVTEGATPVANLTLAGSTIYGTAQTGGTSDAGVIFKLHDSTSTAGINTLKNQVSLKLYPNPSSGQFNFVVSGKEQGIREMQVYNVMGQEISGFTINQSQFKIDLSSQPNGVYLYRVIAEDGSPVGQGKLVIQK